MGHAVVTGTSRGLGPAIARALLDRGWDVVGVARSAAPPHLAEPGRAGARYAHIRLDLGDPEALEAALADELSDRLAPAGCDRVALVNNAARLAPIGPATSLDAPALAAHLAVNVAAPARLAGAVLAAAPDGVPIRIVNVSSGAATRAYPGWTAYCAGKAALAMTSAVLAAELEAYPQLAGRDVRVVDYAPHVVATPMQQALRATDPADFPLRQRFVDLHEAGDLVPPEGPAREIAELVERDDGPVHDTLRYRPGESD